MVGSKQVQVLDLVVESDGVREAKSTVTACPLPPRKRPKVLIDISSEALIMPEPDTDHQVIKLK